MITEKEFGRSSRQREKHKICVARLVHD